MYTIYINRKPLILTDVAGAKEYKASKFQPVLRYVGIPRYLYQVIDNLEKSTVYEAIIVYSNQLEKLKADFFNAFKVEEAGGGLVLNQEKEVLMILRNGYWDMAKGHIEKGETREAAAIREVQEETGVQNIELGEFIQTTYHTYRNRKNKRILKLSHWFRMTSNDIVLVPQEEEGIEKVVWMPIEAAKKCTPIYQNILNILNEN